MPADGTSPCNNNSNSAQLVYSVHIEHPRFVRVLEAARAAIRLGGAGVPPPCLEITGPANTGKTRLFEILRAEFPTVKDGCAVTVAPGQTFIADRIPVLFIEPGDKPTEKSLCMDALEAMGDPYWARDATSLHLMTRRLDKFLAACQTKAIVIDEAQRFVDRGGKIIGENLLEWLKSRRDRSKVTIILFGLGRINILFSSDQQMHRRFDSEIRFEPYMWRTSKTKQAEIKQAEEDQACWIGVLVSFVEPLEVELAFDITEELNAYRFYYAGRGKVGGIAQLWEATLRGDGGPVVKRRISLADLAAGFEKACRKEQHGMKNPFLRGFSIDSELPPEDFSEFKTRNRQRGGCAPSEHEIRERLTKR